MQMIKPRALKPGSHIRLVSPSSPIPRSKTERGISMLKERGFEISEGNHTFDTHHYLAGIDEARAKDLMEAFTDPDVDCVFCTRGGYGSARLLPYLDIEKITQSGKMFCGFSDVTSLHTVLNKAGLVTMHMPMLITFVNDREEWVYESFMNCLEGKNPVPETAKKGETMVSGIAEGTLTGGCLCLLTDSIGTMHTIDWKDKIVLIEDVDEYPHRIDAMLTHLLNSGIAEQAAGFVIGEMTRTDEHIDEGIGGWGWKEIVKDRLASLGKPMMVDFPCGHMNVMLSLPLGVQVKLDADSGTLTYLESACQAD